MKKLILSSFALAAFVFVTNSASAQSNINAESALVVKVPVVMDLSASTASQTLTFVTAQNLQEGMTTSPLALSYKSNKLSLISIKATDFTDGTNTVPLGTILGFKISGETFTTMLKTDQTLIDNNEKGTGTINITYKVTPDLTMDPANYSSTIYYTITAH